MSDLVKKTTVLALIAGLLVGFFLGFSIDGFVDNSVENKSDNESDGLSNYEIMMLQLRERVKGYSGLTDSVKRSAGINENQDPQKVSRKIKEWLSDNASCRHYATLSFTILAEQGYENLTLHTGYIKTGNEELGHMWLKWENESLEYPQIPSSLYVTENTYSKKQLWTE